MTTASHSPVNSPPGADNGSGERAGAKHVTKLSTSSPEAIRVAAAITPNRLANLLIRKGPLAIRLITSHLSQEVPGFEYLSLSKQRRLIMAAMEQGDPGNNVVFEKIGWGQWAVRHVDSDYIVTEPSASHDSKARISIHELREKAKLGWSKKESVHDGAVLQMAKAADRRHSISNNKSNLHNMRLPGEALDTTNEYSDSEQDSDTDELDTGGMLDRSRLRLALVGDHAGDIDDNAIDEDSDEDAEDDALFKFEDDDHVSAISKFKRSPPLRFANRVPTKFSPPPPLTRRTSATATNNAVSKNTGPTRHQLFNRSRLNSLENLDDYLVSTARGSVASPSVQTNSVPSTSPLGSWNVKSEFMNQYEFTLSSDNIASALQSAGRRKSSFNESSIRSTLSSSLPRAHASNRQHDNGPHHISMLSKHAFASRPEVASDTDEEDWATMGAERLKQSAEPQPANQEEHTAATALVNLMGT